jgi:hypothetical protein
MKMKIKDSNSNKYFSNSNINLKTQIYIHFITEISIFRFDDKFQNSNINF